MDKSTGAKRNMDSDSPASKKRRVNVQNYKHEYKLMWPCLDRSKKGEHFVFCSTCSVDFSCNHGGRSDCKRHCESKSHKDYDALQKTSSVRKFFVSNGQSSSVDTFKRSVTRAEAMMCQLIATHNLSLSTASSLTEFMKEMIPDSKIVKEIKCCRSKATAIIKELSSMQMASLADRMKILPFSIATDGSNDVDKKQFPIVVRISQEPDGGVNSVLLSIPICEGPATGENIFRLLDQEFTAHAIPWKNCVAFGSDNASVMTGQHKGVIAYLRQKQADIFLSGCALHLVHIGARKGAECLPPVEDVLVDIFHYFKKSVNRQHELKDLQTLYDVEQRKMLKHVCTRWLSIGRCLGRLLDNWDPLKQLFVDAKDSVKSTASTYSSKKVEEIASFLRSPTNKLFCLFLAYTIKAFDGVLVRLQAEEPMIHLLHAILSKLLRDLFSRFLKPSALMGKNVHEVDYSRPENMKEDGDIMIGSLAINFIAAKEANHLRNSRVKEFFVAIKQYFIVTCRYLLEKLPFKDPVLLNAVVADPCQQLDAKASSLQYFLQRFPCLLQGTATDMDAILEQFACYQSEDVSTCKRDRADLTWIEIGNQFPSFKSLSQVMLGILTIPHSSAACERVFSCVRKNSTDQRASLKQETMEALMVLKSKPGSLQLSDKDLDHLKGAYYNSLKQ